ncbi:MAG: efflux RND transporter periplasmic adaptor subunit [Candidatus Entotheonellia bacterium]
MTRWGRITLLVFLVGAIASALLYWKWPRENIEAVTLVEATPGTIEQVIVATGSVEARRKVLVTADPGTRIAALYFDEQGVVAKGQVLAKLDDIELSTQLRQMEAGLNLAKTNLSNAEAILAQTRSLFEKGYIARQEVDAAAYQVDLYRTQTEEKRAAIQLFKAKLDRTLIRAPISGAITRKLVEVGGIVSDGTRGAGAGPGGQLQPTAIAEIAHLEALEFHVDVDQTEIGLIKRGMRAVIVLDAFPDQRLRGAVEEITLSSLEEVSGRVRYKVRVALEKSNAPIRLGMTGTVDFILARKEHTLTLPAAVLIERGGEVFVFVVEDGKVRQRSVQIGIRNAEVVEIAAGLRAGEWVIDQGRGRVKDGQTVDILNGRR